MSLPAAFRVNVPVPFPPLVKGSGFISLVKVNGVWTIAADYTLLGAPIPVINPASKAIALLDLSTGAFGLTTLDQVQPASAVAFTPSGGISATNVQAALVELDTEKASIASLANIAFSGAGVDIVDNVIPWTPVLTFAVPGDLAVAYTTQVGSYIKHGKMVILQFNVVTSSFIWTTSSGQIRLNGVPFAPNATAGVVFRGPMQFGGITKAGYTAPVVSLASGLPGSLQVNMSGSGLAASGVVAADTPSGGTISLIGEITYFTA